MTDNPSVNRYLTDKAFDHIDHAIGRPIFPLRESYRNHFATEAGGELAQAFDASPNWALTGVDKRMAFYHVTDAGRAALDEHLQLIGEQWRPFVVQYRGFERIIPALTRAKAKYSYWLAISDIAPDLTFVAFSRDARVRLAA